VKNEHHRKDHVMNKKSAALKTIGYAFGASIAASLIVLLVGIIDVLCVLNALRAAIPPRLSTDF
jgi:hypothetical protein